ncbi:hypothetical protein CHLRE_13g589426v5 [Chlamydomonas reinhardtii]|uniref:Uncharacterized protein n=1 Tax=Chlamydomonas reinhardtii TaxID=3055 RepID=A0A2K3D0Z3_CHLRE|nr:uncharacterized protein CHLRE_13g589426v5 [Chlamydomonas reinhardtii]PNW74205.1 hypothetical protein CHLRE_13g589426v5 [Chlamydomonas reinhardtii]
MRSPNLAKHLFPGGRAEPNTSSRAGGQSPPPKGLQPGMFGPLDAVCENVFRALLAGGGSLTLDYARPAGRDEV